MKKQKGEIILGAALVAFLFGIMVAVVVPDATYQARRAESCPEERWDTTREQREICYAEKHANDVGMTLTEK